MPEQLKESAILRAYGLTQKFVNIVSPKNSTTDVSIENDRGQFMIQSEKKYNELITYMAGRNNKLNVINPEYIRTEALRAWDSTLECK